MTSTASTASTTSVASMTSTVPYHQKTFNLRENCIFLLAYYFLLLKNALKSQNNSKVIKEQAVLTNWAIDGAHYQKKKKKTG